MKRLKVGDQFGYDAFLSEVRKAPMMCIVVCPKAECEGETLKSRRVERRIAACITY